MTDDGVDARLAALHSSLTAEEANERAQLLHLPGVWLVREPGQCVKCGKNLAVGDLVYGAPDAARRHADPRDCVG